MTSTKKAIAKPRIIIAADADDKAQEIIKRDGGRILTASTEPVLGSDGKLSPTYKDALFVMLVELPAHAEISSGQYRETRCISWQTATSDVYLGLHMAPQLKDCTLRFDGEEIFEAGEMPVVDNLDGFIASLDDAPIF